MPEGVKKESCKMRSLKDGEKSERSNKKASPPLFREDDEQYAEVGACVLRTLSIQFGEIAEDVSGAMLDQKLLLWNLS